MLKKFLLIVIFVSSGSSFLQAQSLLEEKNNFTRQDTLRGSITPERSWWDLTYYHLNIKVEPEIKFISGSNTIQYKVIDAQKDLQIDLQPPLKITKVVQDGEELEVNHDGNAHYIKLKSLQNIGSIKTIEIFYEGNPKEAVRAPWDGGFSWKKDDNGNDPSSRHEYGISWKRNLRNVGPNSNGLYLEQ